MRIDRNRLSPLFEQYTNQENRLTHALLHTIGSSEWLLLNFLEDFVGIQPPPRVDTYEISTQKVPFSHGDKDTGEVESIPDAWIVNESLNLGIAIEAKDRKNSLRIGQLRRHANRIASYEHAFLLIITPDFNKPGNVIEFERERVDINVIWSSWNDVYRWLRELAAGSSKRKKEYFLAISMQEYLERRREVLGFQGIFFSKEFDVLEAKAILNAEMTNRSMVGPS